MIIILKKKLQLLKVKNINAHNINGKKGCLVK